MKKVLYLLLVVLIAAATISPALAGSEPPADPPPWRTLFMPLLRTGAASTYTVSGQVKDANDQALSGVKVTSDTGVSVTTDEDGVYSMVLPQGDRSLTAEADGKNFDPGPAWIQLKKNTNNVNFSAAAGCVTPTYNPSFESLFYWNPISGGAAWYTPYYTNVRANTGIYSGFTGIPVGYYNANSLSRWRSHEVFIPTDAISITLNLAMWPRTTEVSLKPSTEGLQSLSGYNADAADAPVVGDWQYAYIIDPWNNWRQLLFSDLSDDQAWVPMTTTVSAVPFRGQWIKLEFGSINDGLGGVTSAFYDDVSLTVCRSGAGPCITPHNLLLNSNFEAGTDWTISAAVNPSVYTGSFFYSPVRSMQSGVPLGTVLPANIWRTSEFYQYVTIPADATYARLSMRLLPHSTDGWGYHIAAQEQLEQKLAANRAAGISPTAPNVSESQYGYICANGACGPGATTLKQLFHWNPIDSYYWLYRSYDLSAYAGQTIGILFGAQDYSDGGNTALYVDDVELNVCP
ncbi:MAG: carboxypeptidase regulatory-like domain-containing protein [Chloroflexota bacterium]